MAKAKKKGRNVHLYRCGSDLISSYTKPNAQAFVRQRFGKGVTVERIQDDRLVGMVDSSDEPVREVAAQIAEWYRPKRGAKSRLVPDAR